MSKTLLVIGAHHDDCEGGAGGIICKAVNMGYRVVLAVLAGNHSSWLPTEGKEKLIREGLLNIAGAMGVEKRFYDLSYHQIKYNDDTVKLLMQLTSEIQPDVAFIHNRYDYWPDHEVSARASLHALRFPFGELKYKYGKRPKVFAYEAGPNQNDRMVNFSPDAYVDITDVMDNVSGAIRQIDNLLTGENQAQTTHARAKEAKSFLRGSECGVEFAEAFVSITRHTQDILS